MPSANVEIVKQAIEHLNKRGEPDWRLYDPDLVWTSRADGPAHFVYRGLDGLRRGNESLREVWAQVRAEIVELIDGGDVVVSVLRWDLRARSGVEIEEVESWVAWVREGKIKRIEQHGSRREALKAAGLRE